MIFQRSDEVQVVVFIFILIDFAQESLLFLVYIPTHLVLFIFFVLAIIFRLKAKIYIL